jgi:predicted TIM-barrel fold metal-dependent hydrolase
MTGRTARPSAQDPGEPTEPRRPRLPKGPEGLPDGVCDTHVHVFGTPDEFPYTPDRPYTPSPASVEDLRALHRALGMRRAVLVQPSPYGTDNSCLLRALARLEGDARGVAVVDPSVPERSLWEMADAGVRGVRVNIKSYGDGDPGAARELLRATAARVAPLDWHLQIYAGLDMLLSVRDDLRRLPVPVVVDHFAMARAEEGTAQKGFDELLGLLSRDEVYVKLSAPYRISRLPDYTDVAPLARALIEAGPGQVLWATDWPHTGGRARDGANRLTPEPFRAEDDARALERVHEWARTPAVSRAILVDNPTRLYGFAPAPA